MRISGTGFAALAALGFASSALAWVPPSFFVVQRLAQRHGPLEHGHFTHRLSIYKRSGDLDKTLTETVVLADGDRAITRLFDDTGAEIASHTRKISGGKGDEIQRPILYDLLFTRGAASIFEHFRVLGLPLKTESDLYSEKEGTLPYKPEETMKYDRLDGKAVVLVGVGTSTQLWVEKDGYLPVKAIFPSAPELGRVSDALEMRFSGYPSSRGFFYPNTVQILRNGALWVKLDTLDARLGAGAAEVAHAKAEPSSDVKDFIETYFKWVR